MIFSAFQREDDDSVFTVVKNISGATIVQGSAVAWSTSSPDGVRASLPTASLGLLRGVAAEAIADGTWGKVQVEGFNSYALVSYTVAITAGALLVPVATKGHFVPHSAVAVGTEGLIYAADTLAGVTAAAAPAKASVFIRCL